jgi:iron complex transport system permease protein
MIAGPDHRTLLPLSAVTGAALMVVADIAARTIDPPAELPVGVLTALMGAPFFLYLIHSRKGAQGLR